MWARGPKHQGEFAQGLDEPRVDPFGEELPVLSAGGPQAPQRRPLLLLILTFWSFQKAMMLRAKILDSFLKRRRESEVVDGCRSGTDER
jgi:hypothetical protein